MDKYLSQLTVSEREWFDSQMRGEIQFVNLKKKTNIKDKIINPLALIGYSIGAGKTTPTVTNIRFGKTDTDDEITREIIELYNTSQQKELLLLVEIMRYRSLGVDINQRQDDNYDSYKLVNE